MQKAKPSISRKFTFIALFGAMSLVALRLVSKPSTNLLQGVLSPLPTLTLGNTANDESEDVAKFFVIEWTTNGVDLVLHRPETVAQYALEVTLAGSTNLVTATWEPYTNVTFAAGETNLAVFVGRAMLDAHAVSNACFFAFINSGDSDGDGLADWDERFNLNTDPYSSDSDLDGMPDGWEVAQGFDPNFAPDALADADEDGVPNLYEFHKSTNPWQYDVDPVQKIVAGGTGAGSAPTLAAALQMAAPYSIVEVAEGVHQGAGWEGIHLPEFPVVVTSPDHGRSRKATIRSSIANSSVFYLSSRQTTHTVVQGLRIELAATNSFQYAFFIGGNVPNAGEPAAATFRNITVRMQNPRTQYGAWFIRHHMTNRLVIAGCTVNAAGATYARGIYAVDSPPMSVENCSFVNFPPDGPGTTSVGIQYESTAANWGNAPSPIPVEVVNCLFDESFANAYAWAPLEYGVPYHVTMANCLMPVEPAFAPEEMSGLVVTNACTDWSGRLAADSPARGAGLPILFSYFDMDGEDWPELPPIGSDAYSEPVDDGADTDGDGLSDYDERTVHGTDPHAADSDGDGLSDSDEVAHGTDPLDARSFYRRVDFTVSGCEPLPDVTNYVGWSASPLEWDDAHSTCFSAGDSLTGTFGVEGTNGAVYVTAYRDFNRNGVCDRETEPFITCTVGASTTVSRPAFAFGDVDNDHVGDKTEFDEGTNPNLGENFCLDLDFTCTDVFQTTNALTFELKLGSEVIWGPATVEGSIWSHDFGHLVTTNGGMLALTVWDDANSNQTCDDGETFNRYSFSVTGHSMSVTNHMTYGSFDRDGDNLPDWWEVANGLSVTGTKEDEYADPDNDGLINLHEFWAGTNPLVPDGSNTLLSVCARSVDDRIRNIVNPGAAVDRFVDFLANGRNGTFVTNSNFWARDLDFGCVSVWYGTPPGGSGEKPATAVTRRHVIMAQHWYDDAYVFRDSGGAQYVRRVIDVYPIGGTDLRLGRLDCDLPDTITIPKVLPSDYDRLISTGKFLPTICMTHEKTASVAELVSLKCSQRNINGQTFNLLGQTDSTNHVSIARNHIRAVTTDGVSGCPVFLVVNSQLVFLFSKHMGLQGVRTWSPYWGPMISHHLNVIQTVIDFWEGDEAASYQLNILSAGDFDQPGTIGGSQ